MCVYSYLRVLMQLLLASSTWAQTCSPDSNSEGVIIQTTDLPTEGVRLYFQEAHELIPSFFMLRASQIEPTGFTSFLPTRAVWCQSANNYSHNGTWFRPPGNTPPGYSVVPTEDIDSPINEPYQMVTCPGQVGLVRDTGVAKHEGLLQCVIRDEHNITHILTVGVYSGTVYDDYAGPVVDPNMQFSLVSMRDADPPQFALTFNSSFGPPTVVECAVDGSSLNISEYSVYREVKNAHFVRNGDLDSVNASQPDTLDVTEVTLTMRVRQAGVYVCTANVMGREERDPQHVVALGTGKSSANITIAATPISVNASIVSTDSIMVTWTAPSPAPDGYEVFYQTAVDGGAVSGGNTNNTELTLTGLSTKVEYTIFVVAFGDTNTIPSPHSNTVTVFSLNITMTTNPNGTLYEATPVDILCNVVNVGVFSNTTGYTITRQWLGSTSITAGPEYAITNDTLRINQLSRARDNKRNITCVAMLNLTSGVQYVQQESIILTVEALSNNLFTPDIIIPGTPTCTAGDNFNIICRLDGVVERLVGTPSVTLSFTNPPGGVSGGQSRDGLAYIRPRIFNPVMIDDAGKYTCFAAVYIPSLYSFFGNTSSIGILQIRIPPPQLTLTITPSTTPLYEGTLVDLTCSAVLNTSVVNTAVTVSIVWTGPSGEQLTNSSRITVMDMLHSSPYTSVVVFDQVDDTDSGDYQCNITVSQNSNNPNILPSKTSATNNLNITVLPAPEVTVSSVGSTEAGQTFKLICYVTTVTALSVHLNVTWVKVAGGSVTLLGNTNRTTPTNTSTTLDLTFSPLTFSHRGVYQCVVDLNISMVTSFHIKQQYNITVQFQPPTVIVQSDNPDLALVAGTLRNLTCTVSLSTVDDIIIMVDFTWSINMSPVSSSDRITTYFISQSGNQSMFTSTLMFNPLSSNTDSREYDCSVDVSSYDDDLFIEPTNASNSTSIIVQSLSPPAVMVDYNGTMSIESYLTLSCVVQVVEGLIVQPDIAWTKRAVSNDGGNSTISVGAARTDNTLTLTFNELNTSDAGDYTCTAAVNVNVINLSVTNATKLDVRLQIPSPSVSLKLSSTDHNVTGSSITPEEYLAGSSLVISCNIVISLSVNTPFSVHVTWSPFDSNSASGSWDKNNSTRVTIVAVRETSPNHYQSQLVFTTLSSSMDTGSYTCSVTVDSEDSLVYVSDAVPVNSTAAVLVQAPTIGEFNVSPLVFTGVEAGCPDSEPYDNFTLVCSARKPALISQLDVTWLHNGTLQGGNVTMNGGGLQTNTLHISSASVSDSGTYQCIARISIPDSPEVNITGSSTVTIKPTSFPSAALVEGVEPAATSAVITIRVDRIAYTRERYFIRYSGVERDVTVKQTPDISGTSNIAATTSSYTISLTGLEENTTYRYHVSAINCIGVTTTAWMTFSTLSDAPEAPPVNCINTTLLPRQVTLAWSPPPPLLQNGVIMEYKLSCPSITNNTITSSTTTLTITTGILPYTSYSCTLTAHNIIGSSPPANCSFETAQDAPDTGPHAFSATSTMTAILFHWLPPVQPNGVITQYTLTLQQIKTVHLNGSTMSKLVCDLQPGQLISVSIRASTVEGDGPEVDIEVLTTEQAFSGVGDLTVVTTGDDALHITWTAPSRPHGFITRYSIVVENNDTEVRPGHRTESITTFTSHSTSGLVPGIPYYITVTPLDSCKTSGDLVSSVNFTRQLSPSVAVSFTASRSPNGTMITISWEPVTLEQARGFFLYRVVLQPATTNKRQAPIIRDVPHSQTSVVIGNLDSGVGYAVNVGVVNEENMDLTGPTGAPLVVAPPTLNTPAVVPSSSSSLLTVLMVLVVLGWSLLLGACAIIFILVPVIIHLTKRNRFSKSWSLQSPTAGNDDVYEIPDNPTVTVNDAVYELPQVTPITKDEKMKMTDCAAYDVHKVRADEKCAHENTEYESVTIL